MENTFLNGYVNIMIATQFQKMESQYHNAQLSFTKWKVSFVTEKVCNSFIKWKDSFVAGKVCNTAVGVRRMLWSRKFPRGFCLYDKKEKRH